MVEILLATYNGERFLREQLDSLLSQSWTDWRLTVSDDGSTDGTAAILDEYAAQNPERVRRLRHGARFGNARDHFFWLMAQCASPYMMFCDQDDVWRPDKVKKTVQELLKAEAACGADTPVLAFTDLTPVDERLKPLAPSLMKMQRQDASRTDYRAILFQNIVTGCAAGINRALARLAQQCADTSRVIMHDWWLAMVAARFGKVVYVNESTALYRQHGGNCVGAKDVMSSGYTLRMLGKPTVVRESIRRKKRQAKAFLAAFQNKLTDENIAFLNRFSTSRSGVGFYWRNQKLIHGLRRLIGFMIWG